MIEDEFLAAMGEASYEKRILAYFDVLGWREKIERAADNPIALLSCASSRLLLV